MHRWLTAGQKTEILILLHQGHRPADIARQFGVTPTTIQNQRRAAGMPPTIHRIFTAEEDAEVAARLDAGEGASALAQEFGVTRHAIYNHYRLGGGTRRFTGAWVRTLQVPAEATDLAYMAGIIDGEGSIFFGSNGGWTVSVNMTDDIVVPWLAQFGGTLGNGTPKNERHKATRSWRVNRRDDVAALLTALLPYLKLKREKAVTAIEAISDL